METKVEKIKKEYNELLDFPACGICFDCTATPVTPSCIFKRTAAIRQESEMTEKKTQAVHLFCDKCLSQALANKDVCPVCQTPDCREDITGIKLMPQASIPEIKDPGAGTSDSRVSDRKRKAPSDSGESGKRV